MQIITSTGGRRQLADLFHTMGAKKISEIGVERGLYSKDLCRKNPQATVYLIDPWKTYRAYREHVTQSKLESFYEITIERTKHFPNAKIIRKSSMEALEDFKDGELDAVYIDANHKYEFVKEDIREWTKKVRAGGIVSGHDYTRRKGQDDIYGVVQAVKELDREITLWKGDNTPSWSFYV